MDVRDENPEERLYHSLLKRSPSTHSITIEYTLSGLEASICVY